jgi:hypothetical protein
MLTNLKNKQDVVLISSPTAGLRKPEGRRINRLNSFNPDATKKHLKI